MPRTMPQVMVLSSEGYLYLYSIDLEKGGECSLIKQYKYVTLSLPSNDADLWIVYLIQRIYCLAWEMTGPRNFSFYPDVIICSNISYWVAIGAELNS
jgi:hypothetical protein